jgi:hypothetical protein
MMKNPVYFYHDKLKSNNQAVFVVIAFCYTRMNVANLTTFKIVVLNIYDIVFVLMRYSTHDLFRLA